MTTPLTFKDQAGNVLDWIPVAWDALITPKPLTTPDLHARAQLAQPPTRVRKDQAIPSYPRARVVFHGIPVVIENPRGDREGSDLTCCTSF